MLKLFIDDKEVKEGDKIFDFRGKPWIFKSITRGGSRVYAKEEGKEWSQEFFPSVFAGKIIDVNGAVES